MKKLYTLCMFALFATAAQAQTYDVGVSGIIYPDTTIDLPFNFNDTIGIIITNYGDSLVSGDTLSIIGKISAPSNPLFQFDSAIVLTLPISQTIPSGVSFGALSPPVDLSNFTSNFEGQDLEVCFRTNLDTQVDAAPSNDEYCFTYTVSSAIPTSANSIESSNVSSFYMNNTLNVQNSKAGNNVTVYNVNGQVVFQNSNGNNTYDLNLSKGLYIVHISNGNQILNTNKILVN